jgi:hypothetical protein
MMTLLRMVVSAVGVLLMVGSLFAQSGKVIRLRRKEPGLNP